MVNLKEAARIYLTLDPSATWDMIDAMNDFSIDEPFFFDFVRKKIDKWITPVHFDVTQDFDVQSIIMSKNLDVIDKFISIARLLELPRVEKYLKEEKKSLLKLYDDLIEFYETLKE